MKVSISYPPLASDKGVPLLTQNRQFQWFSDPTYIYPMVPAYAATMLQAHGHEVLWDDGIATGKNYIQWLSDLRQEKPDIIVLESKTPVIKRHWKIIEELKKQPWAPLIILIGDHVTALPAESMENCPVDFIITGGDYDFVLSDLLDFIDSDSVVQDKVMPQGIWYRKNGKIFNTGTPDFNHDVNTLPTIDRDLTCWELYAHKNGNFKYKPGTYVMAGRDCWWGKCSFCSWTTLYPGKTYRTVSVEQHVSEIEELINRYGVREIFDDSGCFPKGKWLEDFCCKIIDKGLHKKVTLGCNMRVGALYPEQWQLMKKAGFRFILIGLESVNQPTLDRLNKAIKVEQIEETIRSCKAAGLEPHVTTMVGYPWETKEDAEKTINFAKRMFTSGYLDTLQATIVVPYPGTPLFREAQQNGWLTTEDWDNYDMKQSVWKSPVSNEDVLAYTKDLYKAALNPAFILRKLFSIREIDDLKFFIRAGIKVFAHLTDFNSGSGRR